MLYHKMFRQEIIKKSYLVSLYCDSLLVKNNTEFVIKFEYYKDLSIVN